MSLFSSWYSYSNWFALYRTGLLLEVRGPTCLWPKCPGIFVRAVMIYTWLIYVSVVCRCFNQVPTQIYANRLFCCVFLLFIWLNNVWLFRQCMDADCIPGSQEFLCDLPRLSFTTSRIASKVDKNLQKSSTLHPEFPALDGISSPNLPLVDFLLQIAVLLSSKRIAQKLE